MRAGNAAGRVGTGDGLHVVPHLKHIAYDPDHEGNLTGSIIQQAHFRDVALIGSIAKKKINMGA